MTPDAAATATARALGDLPSRYMLDPATYIAGAADGFEGMDLYVAGRGGALGDVDADVVTAAFVFFAPDTVRASWERSAAVMPRSDAADRWATACHSWAEANLPTDVDLDRLATLLGTMVETADVAAAPCFAAWRARPEPDPDRVAALVLHRMMVLRELRGGLHGAAVVAQGLSPHAALSIRSAPMLGVFGWDGRHPDSDEPSTHAAWAEAEVATDRAMATAYVALDPAERTELRHLLDAVHAPFTS